MESSRRQRRCGRVQRPNYPDWFYRRRSWRRMVHAICDWTKEDERCRSACERDRHALCRTGNYRSPRIGSAGGAWRICSLAVVAESSIRRMALLRGGNFDWSFAVGRSEEHTSELQSRVDLVCRLLLE